MVSMTGSSEREREGEGERDGDKNVNICSNIKTFVLFYEDTGFVAIIALATIAETQLR